MQSVRKCLLIRNGRMLSNNLVINDAHASYRGKEYLYLCREKPCSSWRGVEDEGEEEVGEDVVGWDGVKTRSAAGSSYPGFGAVLALA